MILTKDNLYKFVKEKKAVTPTIVSEKFETTTLVASAALSELVNKKLLKVTDLKIGSSPFYYDPEQKEVLQELAEKHLSSKDYPMYNYLKKNKIVNDILLSPAEKLSIRRIKDYAIPLEIEFNGKNILFWVWYMLDLNDTRNKILDALNSNSNKNNNSNNNNNNNKVNENIKKESNDKKNEEIKNIVNKNIKIDKNIKVENKKKKEQNTKILKHINNENKESDEETIIENYLRDNNLKINNKVKEGNNIVYECTLNINFPINFDCKYFSKKINETDLISFYTSSLKPKIIFLKNSSKKIKKIVEKLDNIFIIDL